MFVRELPTIASLQRTYPPRRHETVRSQFLVVATYSVGSLPGERLRTCCSCLSINVLPPAAHPLPLSHLQSSSLSVLRDFQANNTQSTPPDRRSPPPLHTDWKPTSLGPSSATLSRAPTLGLPSHAATSAQPGSQHFPNQSIFSGTVTTLLVIYKMHSARPVCALNCSAL